jgi:hypothetical protein
MHAAADLPLPNFIIALLGAMEIIELRRAVARGQSAESVISRAHSSRDDMQII